METKESMEEKAKFGLLGKDIDYSFSRGYFTKKFDTLGLKGYEYVNFDLPSLEDLPSILNNTPNLKGMNVTIPYKQEVMAYLDNLEASAAAIGAVNTIRFGVNGLEGHNTDAYGFAESIKPYLQPHHQKALILGTGGASKAIAYVLETLGINFQFVSRNKRESTLSYGELTVERIQENTLIINCTPLGTYPNIERKPELPYTALGEKHLLYDLVYNPEKTAFLQAGEAQGTQILNGYRMLELQAEKAWEIWNS